MKILSLILFFSMAAALFLLLVVLMLGDNTKPVPKVKKFPDEIVPGEIIVIAGMLLPSAPLFFWWITSETSLSGWIAVIATTIFVIVDSVFIGYLLTTRKVIWPWEEIKGDES